MSEDSKKGTRSKILEYLISIVAAFVIAFAFRQYVFARADVDGQSMQSTLHDKDVIFVEKLSLFSHNFKRGQIVIFNSHNYADDIYVKRVIGIDGDEIELKDGKVFLNGIELQEDYLDDGTVTNPGTFLRENQKYKVEKNQVFVLGDNRGNSVDSRSIGPINVKDIQGHVVVRIYPFSKMRTF
jgi:signal peptidase I